MTPTSRPDPDIRRQAPQTRKNPMDVDYAVAGVALLLGSAVAALLALSWLLRTGQIPNTGTVIASLLISTIVIITVVEVGIPH